MRGVVSCVTAFAFLVCFFVPELSMASFTGDGPYPNSYSYPSMAIQTNVMVSESSGCSTDLQWQLVYNTLDRAFEVVHGLVPKDGNLFRSKQKGIFQSLFITPSRTNDNRARQFLASLKFTEGEMVRKFLEGESEDSTFASIFLPLSRAAYVHLFVDRIFFNPDGTVRPDYRARLFTAVTATMLEKIALSHWTPVTARRKPARLMAIYEENLKVHVSVLEKLYKLMDREEFSAADKDYFSKFLEFRKEELAKISSASERVRLELGESLMFVQ